MSENDDDLMTIAEERLTPLNPVQFIYAMNELHMEIAESHNLMMEVQAKILEFNTEFVPNIMFTKEEVEELEDESDDE